LFGIQQHFSVFHQVLRQLMLVLNQLHYFIVVFQVFLIGFLNMIRILDLIVYFGYEVGILLLMLLDCIHFKLINISKW
jgi:hypothetical protein